MANMEKSGNFVDDDCSSDPASSGYGDSEEDVKEEEYYGEEIEE
jgi:hypothetical protein